MNCPVCGTNVAENAQFCPSCGSTVSQQPVQQKRNLEPDLPMNWFKFLIFFSLFANAVINLYSGFQVLTGAHYDGAAELVYAIFEGLETLDMIFGVATIALAVFAIYVRFRLAGFYANGPKLLNTLYVLNLVASLLYVIAGMMIIEGVAGGVDAGSAMTSYYASIATSVVMIIANNAYFKKREHLFVN